VKGVAGATQTLGNTQQSAQQTLNNAIQQANQTFNTAKAQMVATGTTQQYNASSLTLANTFFGTLIPAGQKFYDQLITLGATAPQTKTAVATMAGEMLKYAGNNTVALQMTQDFINNGLGPGTVSLQSMKGWVDKNTTSYEGLNGIMAGVLQNASKMAGVFQGVVTGAMANAALAARGGQTQFNNFASAVLAGDSSSRKFKTGGAAVLNTVMAEFPHNIVAAKKSFTDFAVNTLGQTSWQAKNLWNILVHNKLGVAANAAGMTKSKFEDLSKQFGIGKGDADKLWASLHKIAAGSPYTAAVVVQNVNAYNTALGNLLSYLQKLTAQAWNVNVLANIQQLVTASGSSAIAAPLAVTAIATGRRAKGGLARGWALVGEEGPELAYFGGRGADIIPAPLTKQALSGMRGYASGTQYQGSSLAGGETDGIEGRLDKLISAHERQAGQMGRAFGRELSGQSRLSAYRGFYSGGS
jgi:hypothetical protein